MDMDSSRRFGLNAAEAPARKEAQAGDASSPDVLRESERHVI